MADVWHCMASGERNIMCSVEWPEDGREHAATNQFDRIDCIPCLRAVIAEMRAGFKAIRQIATDEGVTVAGPSLDSQPEGKAWT